MIELSILVPSYNRARSLERCLRSALASHADTIEVIVCDNASPDDTPAVVASFHDPRLRSLRNETNIGMARNFLHILRAAQGKWVFYLTDDDYLRPGAIEKLLPVLRAHDDVGLFLSPLRIVKDDGSVLPDYRFSERSGRFAAGADALLHLTAATHVLSRITLRREWIDLAGTERHLGSDYPQTYMAGSVIRDHPGYYLDEVLVAHTTDNQTFWDYTPDMMVASRLRLFDDMLPGPQWIKERRALWNQLIASIVRSHFKVTWKKGQWLAHQRTLQRIPEVRHSLIYWRGLVRFLLKKAWRGAKAKIRGWFNTAKTPPATP